MDEGILDLVGGKLYQADLAGLEVEHRIRPRFELKTSECARIVDAGSALHLISSTVGVPVKNVLMGAGIN